MKIQIREAKRDYVGSQSLKKTGLQYQYKCLENWFKVQLKKENSLQVLHFQLNANYWQVENCSAQAFLKPQEYFKEERRCASQTTKILKEERRSVS